MEEIPQEILGGFPGIIIPGEIRREMPEIFPKQIQGKILSGSLEEIPGKFSQYSPGNRSWMN